MENSVEVPQKTKSRLPYDPTIPLRGIYSKEIKTPCQRGNCTPIFIAALFIIAKTCKQLKGRNWIKVVKRGKLSTWGCGICLLTRVNTTVWFIWKLLKESSS